MGLLLPLMWKHYHMVSHATKSCLLLSAVRWWGEEKWETSWAPKNPHYLLFLCQVLLHFETEHQFKQEAKIAKAIEPLEGAWSSKGTSSRRGSCDNKTGAVKCWWDCQTKVEKWHIHQQDVRTCGIVEGMEQRFINSWKPHMRCVHLVRAWETFWEKAIKYMTRSL